jgi:nucleoside-diphosphate-sugar epimerase
LQALLIVGCGYLGLRLAQAELARGTTVYATTRGRADSLAALGIRPVNADVTQPTSLTQLPQVDACVYCVGFDRRSGHDMRTVYVDGLANVLHALPTPGRFVYVSSTSVYGQTDGSLVDESASTEPVESGGQIVLAAEQLLTQLQPNAVRLRFAGIYGPGRLLREASIRAGEPIAANPERWLNLIHVDDGVRAVQAALAQPMAGVVNVSDDAPQRRRDFYTYLATVLGAPAPTFVPAPPGQPHDHAHRRISNRKLRQELGVTLQYPECVAGLRASSGNPAPH